RLTPVSHELGADLARRFTAAARECEARHQRWRAREAQHAALVTLAEEAEALADERDLSKPTALEALEERWAALEASETPSEDITPLRLRFTSARERLKRRWREVEQQRTEIEGKNLARLEALCSRLEEMPQSEGFKSAAARRQLDAADAAL